MRNSALFLLSCFLFVSLFNLPLLVSAQSNPTGKDVFQVTEGSKLFSKAEDIIHFKPSEYTGSPWNFNMNDLYDSSLYFRKSASFWVRHNFTSAPASEVRLVRAASTLAKAPVIATDAHFMVILEWNAGSIQLKLTYPVTGTTIVTQTLTSLVTLKPFVWYGVFISRNVLAGSDQGALFVYNPSTVSGSNYAYDLQAPATVAPAGYSSTSATANFYIDIGGDTQISSPSLCEIANFNFMYKTDFYNTAASIFELIKQPPRLVLWLEYKEIDSDVQLIKDFSNENNVVFRGESQFDTNRDTTLNYGQTTAADVGHIYSQNGFDTIFPAFDLGREYAVSFWAQFNTRPSTVTTDTNQIIFFKQNSQFANMRIKVGFVTTTTTVTGIMLQSGNTVKTENLVTALTRGDSRWYYFYVYFANFYKNETSTGPTSFHPTTLYSIRHSRADGTMAATISNVIDDYFIHGGTTDAMRIGMGVDGQNENFYGVLKKFQIFTGGWNFDVTSDPSAIVLGGAKTIHITKGALSSRVFSQKCATGYQLVDNDCQTTCPDGTYQVTTDTNYPHCESCYENCKTCTGRKEQMCQSCFYGNWDPFGLENCPGKNPCNVHQYDTGTYCQECNNECASCKSTLACTACSDGYAYNLNTKQCEIATCGDGVVHAGEQCDDGNQFDGDGCSTSCTIEQGFYCPQYGGSCYSICGDNVRASDEKCDDGNNINGDGCNNVCQVEDNYFCTPIATAANIGPYYGASYKESCTTCGLNCKTCATATTCSQCATSYFLLGTSCTNTCPGTGYYPNSTSQTCNACPGLCSTCTSDTVCTLCSGTNALYNNLCYDNCPDGKYNGLDSGSGKQMCLDCPSHCVTCSSSTSCYTCDEGYYLQTPGATPGTCQQCDGTCRTCRGSATTDCILCPAGRTLKTATSECVILSCATNEYANSSIGECQACDGTCSTCFNTLSTGCKTCPSLHALTVTNQCFDCNVADNLNGLYLIGNTCNDICGDGKRVMKTTGCDDGNTDDGDGCSSKCVVESGWSCTGGSETTSDTCVSLVGPKPIITVNSRDPTSFLISFDRKIVNTLQESEYVTQIVVDLQGLDPDLRLYKITWDATEQTFLVSFDLKESAINSLMSVQFVDPSRITDAFSNRVSPSLHEMTYPTYYYVDPETRQLASDLSSFSIVIQSINTASIIPLALTGYLNHYWLFLESFQVVHDLLLINVRTPYVAREFFKSFHFMRMNWLPNALSYVNYDESQQFGRDAFYDEEITTFYLYNNGYQLTTWVFLLTVWLSLKIVITIGLKNTWLKQLIYSIMVNLEWSIILRAVIILFFDFCIYSFLQLTNLSSDYDAITASSAMAIASTVFIALFPIFCIYQTMKVKNQYLLTTDTKFDTLYREYKKRFKSTITFLSISLYQKAVIAALLVGLQAHPEAQIATLVAQEIIMLLLILCIRPYVDGSMNFRAILQELIMFGVFAMFYGLTNENTDENVRDNVGKVIVGLIVVALLMHLAFLIKDSYLTIKNHYKRPGKEQQIFGKVRITPQSGQEEFQLNNGENPELNLSSSERVIPKSQDHLSMEDGSPQNQGENENENTHFRDTISPATPTKESLFKY